ncbi:hypothetical protein [Brachybacterium sp. FME24]|uniref:hypothetical protein n=1 Tax=Brachybacterium sp. FME24 TaxID=2742605 RepID=UPI0018667C19|nr:hypothetical protein [Brachybacterium sp. FME24]
MEIESATDEKVDYAEWHSQRLTRAVQVKASAPTSSTRLYPGDAREILDHLSRRNPSADVVVLESNRRREGDWAQLEAECSTSEGKSGPTLTAEHDGRQIEDVEADIAAALRNSRLQSGITTDPTSIRHLSFVLEAKLFQLGSIPFPSGSTARRVMTSAEWAELLDISGQQIASLLGVVPWGRHWAIPATNRVPREDVFSWLSGTLPESALALPGPPGYACLTGFSGAGKSSAAAGWADLHQERYGMVLWLTASDEEPLADSVRQLLSAEFGDDVLLWDLQQVRVAFLDLLGRTPLSWLLVFDDASSSKVIRRWLPSRGFGHVLITTTDSTWPPSSAQSIEVPAMGASEIKSLIARRLGPESLTIDAVGAQAALERLTIATAGWPLAIEMIIAWLARTGRPITDIHVHLDHLSEVLLDHDKLVPSGYPATVVAAVIDALDTVQAGPDPLAWNVLLTCARLGSRSVPVHLLTQALTPPPPQTTAIDAAIAALRESSLVRREQLEAPVRPQWRDRLVVNDIIGRLTLELALSDDDSEIRAWEVLDVALRTSIDNRQFHDTASLSPIVSAILDETHHGNRPTSLPGLTLHGNLALLHDERGEYEEAEALLLWEVDLAHTIAANDDVPPVARRAAASMALLTYVQLIMMSCRAGSPSVALDAAEIVVRLLTANPGTFTRLKEKELLRSVEIAVGSIRHEEFRSRRDNLLKTIRRATVDLPSHPLEQVEIALRERRLDDAENLIATCLEEEADLLVQLQMQAHRAELAAHRDPPSAPKILALATNIADSLGAGHTHVASATVDCAHAAWSRALVSGATEGYSAVIRDRHEHAAAIGALLPFLPDPERIEGLPGNQVRTHITLAVHAVLAAKSDARRLLDRAQTALDGNADRLSEEESVSLRATTLTFDALYRWSERPHAVEALAINRSGSLRTIVLSPWDMTALSQIGPLVGPPEVKPIAWFVLLTVRGSGGSVTILIDVSGLPEKYFDGDSGIVLFSAIGTDASTTIDGRQAVEVSEMVMLGPAQIQLESWVADALTNIASGNSSQ